MGMGTQSTCVSCGRANESCCPGSVCQAGLGCNDPGQGPGMCLSTCGASGGPCCAGENCQPNLRCLGAPAAVDGGVSAQTCQACGVTGQRCCNRGLACRAGSACVGGVGNGMCMACGGSGQACCEDDVCNQGLVCRVPTGTTGPQRCEPMMM